jgi:hypothetical protein
MPRRFAQQARSNYALPGHTSHHMSDLPLSCNALPREVSWWAHWWGPLDGMQEVRGSNPLSSTSHNTFSGSPLSAGCQQIVSKSRLVTAGTL